MISWTEPAPEADARYMRLSQTGAADIMGHKMRIKTKIWFRLLRLSLAVWATSLGKREHRAPLLSPLTPKYDPEKHAVYFHSLDAALSRRRPVLNLALTGSYGVGKSSILEELARRHKRRVIAISLSTLGLDDEVADASGTAATPTSKTNRIQKEIVKQLLYSQDPVRMPGSRYRRVTRFRFWRGLWRAVLSSVPVTVVFYLTGWTASLSKLVPLPADWAMLIHVIVGMAAVGLILGFHGMFHNRIQIEKITAGSATIALSAKTATYFDEYLDEIVYFFEVVRRDIVIFEDIDRFDDAHIFETLRALNSILNGAKQLKRRRIRFVYAIKDSIFDELGTRAAREELDGSDQLTGKAPTEDAAEAEVARANRTKFFDLVIPVVPFVTHRTARDLIVKTMKDVDDKISTELIDLTARHVADMRLIKNIRNEYAIFKHQILDKGSLELDRDKLFAMMLYKSTHLSDFEQIKLGKSNLDALYRDSRALVSTNVRALNERVRRAREKRAKLIVSSEKSEALGTALLKHIKISVFDMGGNHIRGFTRGQQQVSDAALRTSEFWEELARSDGKLTINYQHPNYGTRSMELTRTQISEALGEPINSQQWTAAQRAKLLVEINQASATSREFLPTASMSDLTARSEFKLELDGELLSFAEIAKLRLNSQLAEQLVAAGYIDRNFTLYTSTFHNVRISANATNFIMKHIEPNLPDAYFELTGKEVAAILREKGQGILRSRSMYNISFLDRLLESQPEAADEVVTRLKTYGDEEREFLIAYFAAGKNRQDLVQHLTQSWPKTLSVLLEDGQLDVEMGIQLVNAALLSLTDEISYVVNESITAYVNSNYEKLRVFTARDITPKQAKRVAALMAGAGLSLPRLSSLGPAMLTEIVANGCYEVSRENISTALGGEPRSLALDVINRANPSVYRKVLGDVTSYLSALLSDEHTVDSNDQFKSVIIDVFEASDIDLQDVVTRADPECRIVELADIPEETWPILAKKLRFPASFENVRDYVNKHGLDRDLALLLQDAGSISTSEGDLEEEKREIAISILSAKNELPSAAFRARLVVGLDLGHYISAASIPRESGDLYGLLIADDVVTDDVKSFDVIAKVDGSTLEFAISKSAGFAVFMTPAHVTPQVLEKIVNSEIVPIEVKDNLVDRFAEFTVGASRGALAALASYALERDKRLTLIDIARLASERLATAIVLPLLQPLLPSLTLDELNTVLTSIGGNYAHLAHANGRRPQIVNTPSDRALVDRLQELGVVSSVKSDGLILKVNMRKI